MAGHALARFGPWAVLDHSPKKGGPTRMNSGQDGPPCGPFRPKKSRSCQPDTAQITPLHVAITSQYVVKYMVLFDKEYS